MILLCPLSNVGTILRVVGIVGIQTIGGLVNGIFRVPRWIDKLSPPYSIEDAGTTSLGLTLSNILLEPPIGAGVATSRIASMPVANNSAPFLISLPSFRFVTFAVENNFLISLNCSEER